SLHMSDRMAHAGPGLCAPSPEIGPHGNGTHSNRTLCLNTSDAHATGNRSLAMNSSGDPFGRNEEVAKLEITVLSLTFLAAVAGNVSVLLAVRNAAKKSSRVHLFIKHLSLADLVVAFFQVLPQLCWEITFRFYGPDFLCRVVKHLQVLGMFASTYMLVMLTVDRYIAICHPLRSLKGEIEKGSDVYDCWGHFIEPWGVRAYITWITVGIFLIPVTVLVMCYGFICRSIWKNVKCKTKSSTAHGTNALIGKASVSSVSTISRAKLRTVKMTFVIVLAYIVCWAPFFIVQMWSVWDENFSWDDSENTAVTLSALLASLNSCCNPWIYMLFGGHLLYDFLRCFPCCRKLRYSIRNDSDSSLRRNTLLSKLPAACTPTNASDSWRDSQKTSQSVIQDCSKVNQDGPVDSDKSSRSTDNVNKHSHTKLAQVQDTDS
ncbi:hypothetical protein QTP86_017646, partial [Hemibagrus guttatus]